MYLCIYQKLEWYTITTDNSLDPDSLYSLTGSANLVSCRGTGGLCFKERESLHFLGGYPPAFFMLAIIFCSK